jgi:hypothetical protein
MHLHLLAVPVLLLCKKTVVLDPEIAEVILQTADLVGPGLLLFLKLFSVFLFPLTGIKTTILLADEKQWRTQTKWHPRPDVQEQKPKRVRTRPACSGGVVFVA